MIYYNNIIENYVHMLALHEMRTNPQLTVILINVSVVYMADQYKIASSSSVFIEMKKKTNNKT